MNKSIKYSMVAAGTILTIAAALLGRKGDFNLPLPLAYVGGYLTAVATWKK